MLQFYFLSVSLNAIAGYFLFFGSDDEITDSQALFPLHNDTVKLAIGALSALTGIIKLFSPVGGSIPVLGDLIPAITGILCGFIFIYDYYKSRKTIDDSEHTEKISGFLLLNRKIIGGLAIIASILHFLLPGFYLL